MLKIVYKTRFITQCAFKFFRIRTTNLFKFSSFKDSKDVNVGIKPIFIIPYFTSESVNSFPSTKELDEIVTKYKAHKKAAKKYPQSMRCIKIGSYEI